jgi:4-hydroxy-3-polyprenylbenzoate decarboxylase
MPYNGLHSFIKRLEEESEIVRISSSVDPVLEVSEITDRIVKSNGKALLFENNGTNYPILINLFGSDKRMALALGKNPDDVAKEIETFFESVTGGSRSIKNIVALLNAIPKRIRRRGKCQEVVFKEADISILPVLKSWPFDGGRFFTLPIVHTVHPETKKKNAGMYRMQVIDNKTTAIHWQRHKTGANHFEAWKKVGKPMPIAVVLGGDPSYTYSATAPLPENIDEYMLAGFIRGKRVKMVKCMTNEILVPDDADIVIEGYVDPSEKLFWEGPFGDHTGFYSLADWYPKFHVTCITTSKNAVFPATIVGVPPMEDAFLSKATEKIFLSPIKLALQPEIEDLHLPTEGVSHNLAIVKIRKNYPGQGKKVISSLFGAGQMSFTKYLVVVDGDIDIRDYSKLAEQVMRNTDFRRDLVFIDGPLDVLDHASDNPALGGKLGLDATGKIEGEIVDRKNVEQINIYELEFPDPVLKEVSAKRLENLPIYILYPKEKNRGVDFDNLKEELTGYSNLFPVRLFVLMDPDVETGGIGMIVWYLLANSDPIRDGWLIGSNCLLIDGTIKAFNSGFKRQWPNIVSSSSDTIERVDSIWSNLGLGKLIESPSKKYKDLIFSGKDFIQV